MNPLSSLLPVTRKSQPPREEEHGSVRPRCFSTRLQMVAGACVCGGATAFVYALDPHQHAFYPQCLLYNTTGIYCAGCGATRALYALLHGRVMEALHDNALFVSALPVMIYVASSYLLPAWKDNRWPQVTADPGRLARLGLFFFALMMGFMVLRNIPGPMFAGLRPI